MTDRNRVTPVDPLPAAKVPRPTPPAPGSPFTSDAQRLIREAASAVAKRPGLPPPLPDRTQERHRTPVSGGIEAQPPSLKDNQEALLRDELAKERAKVAQLERDARAVAEAKQVAFPPKVEPQRSVSPAPTSASEPDAKVDRAIGHTVRLLLARFGWPALAALGIGGVALKPTADPAKADATLAVVQAVDRKVDAINGKVNGILDREITDADFVDCLYDQQREYFEQLLPSQERLVTGELRRTWVDRCRNRKPKR